MSKMYNVNTGNYIIMYEVNRIQTVLHRCDIEIAQTENDD